MWILSRRQFMGAAMSAGLVGVMLPHDSQLASAASLGEELAAHVPHAPAGITPAQPSMKFSVDRESDLLQLDFTFYGFTLVSKSGKLSLKATAKQTNFNWIGVVVQFPPQAIAEADYQEASAPPPPFDPTPVLSQMAGPSRLAFTFHNGDSIPLPTQSFADLLNWSGWTLSVAPSALSGSGQKTPVQPASYQSAIECPLDLIMSPVSYVNPTSSRLKTYSEFISSPSPKTSPRQVTECWTTKLTRVETGARFLGPAPLPQVSAVWSNDYKSASTLTPEQYILYNDYIQIA
jgi:hypothetical protein